MIEVPVSPSTMRRESITVPSRRKKGWLVNSLITVATVVTLIGLARVSPLVAWIVSAVGLAALLTLFYVAGRQNPKPPLS
jgi:hypothetical protein